MAIDIKIFTFNPFLENTYIVYNEHGTAVLIDPGCSNTDEENALLSYIENNNLKLKHLINTHAHIDHILGNKLINKKYALLPLVHNLDVYNFEFSLQAAKQYGIHYEVSPLPKNYLKEGDKIYLDEDVLEVILTPGHSAGSISLYSQNYSFIISGDAIFKNSIGRVDLPGGNLKILLESIKNKILNRPENTKIYPGHGDFTTVYKESKYNPFIK